jgi:hypothetical protein
MTGKNGSNFTLEKIDLYRNELNKLLAVEKLPSENVLFVSQKLDEVIVKYYLENKVSKV